MKKHGSEIRAALIAAFVAVAVAAPLSNAASDSARAVVKIVKGKQGKTGKRGPRGLQGPAGPAGAQGQPGRDAGVSLFGPKVVLPGDTVTVLAKGCKNDEAFVGGEWHASAGLDPGLQLVREGVSEVNHTYYFAVITNPTDDHATVEATADCE